MGQFVREEEGQGMAEYGLILAGVAVVAIVGIKLLGIKIDEVIDKCNWKVISKILAPLTQVGPNLKAKRDCDAIQYPGHCFTHFIYNGCAQTTHFKYRYIPYNGIWFILLHVNSWLERFSI